MKLQNETKLQVRMIKCVQNFTTLNSCKLLANTEMFAFLVLHKWNEVGVMMRDCTFLGDTWPWPGHACFILGILFSLIDRIWKSSSSLLYKTLQLPSDILSHKQRCI